MCSSLVNRPDSFDARVLAWQLQALNASKQPRPQKLTLRVQVESIAYATVSQLAKIKGLGDAKVAKMKEAAAKLHRDREALDADRAQVFSQTPQGVVGHYGSSHWARAGVVAKPSVG